jgi:hypothetical protein
MKYLSQDSVPAKIRTENLPNTNPDPNHETSLIRVIVKV